MDCRSCGVVNAPGRRYCRECGARLGQACPECFFCNNVEDKHCGGCGRRLKTGVGPLAAEGLPAPASHPALGGDASRAPLDGRAQSAVAAADTDIGGQGVSQSEIDGLFENILDEDQGEPTEDGS